MLGLGVSNLKSSGFRKMKLVAILAYTFTTTNSNQTVSLPYKSYGIYSGTINWGDGLTSINSYANRNHTYAIAGTYNVTIN